jgi:hypothetical protein
MTSVFLKPCHPEARVLCEPEDLCTLPVELESLAR